MKPVNFETVPCDGKCGDDSVHDSHLKPQSEQEWDREASAESALDNIREAFAPLFQDAEEHYHPSLPPIPDGKLVIVFTDDATHVIQFADVNGGWKPRSEGLYVHWDGGYTIFPWQKIRYVQVFKNSEGYHALRRAHEEWLKERTEKKPCRPGCVCSGGLGYCSKDEEGTHHVGDDCPGGHRDG